MQQVDGKVFVKEVSLGAYILLVQRMQNGVTGTVSRCAGARGLFTAKVHALAAKLALVDLAVVQSRERYAEMLQFVHGLGCCAAHVFDGILVTEIIAALDSIEHVPVPAVRPYIRQCRVYSALCGNSV